MTKILVVDDIELIRKTLPITLKLINKDLEVITASDGLEGLAELSKEKPRLILTDYKMPNMNGIEFIQKARELGYTREIILMSGNDYDEIMKLTKNLHNVKFLEKPIGFQLLKRTVEKYLKN